MLIMPKQNIFRVAASGDSDSSNKLAAATVAALGFSTLNASSGLVAYGPEENAGNVMFKVQAVGSSPDVQAFSYTRMAGPIDVPMALAITFCRNGLATVGANDVQPASPQTGEITEVWKAGSIAGETDVPYSQIESLQGSAMPVVATGTTALPDEAWVYDPNP